MCLLCLLKIGKKIKKVLDKTLFLCYTIDTVKEMRSLTMNFITSSDTTNQNVEERRLFVRMRKAYREGDWKTYCELHEKIYGWAVKGY